MDVQRADITDLSRLAHPSLMSHADTDSTTQSIREFWKQLCQGIAQAQRPLILAGGGIRSSNAADVFRRFSKTLGIPVVNSLMGVDTLANNDQLRVGLIGSYGNRWANIVLSECDLLLVLGSRLDVRQTGADTVDFKGHRPIYHVDCDPGELNNRVGGCITLDSKLIPFFQYALDQALPHISPMKWTERIAQLKSEWPDTRELAALPGINPNLLMHQLCAHSGAAKAFTVDVGQHQMWAAQSLDVGADQRFLTSGGMGAMGFALPAAIGACEGAGGQPVVAISGDGGFQLNIQELQTIAHHRLPIKMIVINNHCHGMVRQFQESYFKSRYQSTVWGYSAPSFASVAQAYGIPAACVSTPENLETALTECWEDPHGPFLLEVGIASEANAYPKMAFGRPISEMEPFAKPLEMEGT
jgi:acetolactate synthase-1/2/3 large subunit